MSPVPPTRRTSVPEKSGSFSWYELAFYDSDGDRYVMLQGGAVDLPALKAALNAAWDDPDWESVRLERIT